MAVYTEVADEELAAFVARFGIGELLAAKGIAEGVENSNYFIHTSAGFFILTLYEKRVSEADLPFFLGLMEHLSGRGLVCPRPVRDRQGEALGRLAGRPAAIVTFLDGISVKRPSVAHCRALGTALGRLHKGGADFHAVRKNALSVEGWRPLFEASAPRADNVRQGLARQIEEALTLLERQWPKDLPHGNIHADLFPDNVFFIGEEVSGVIDFYFACTDALSYDLAVCLNAWCFEPDGAFNMTKGQALLSGYQKLRALTSAEKQALPLLARGAALRFLLTRLVDWLNVPPGALVKPKDPIEYLRKLRFHARVANAAEYGLGP
jgi:homoserine kinase type II